MDELRACWLRERAASGNEAILVELVDVRFVDAAGKALLAEMHSAGLEIRAHSCLTRAMLDEIVAASRHKSSEVQ